MSNTNQTLAEKAFFAHPLVRVIEDDGIEKVVKLSRYVGSFPQGEMKQHDVEELIEVLCFCNGYLVSRQYFDYSKRDASALFKA